MMSMQRLTVVHYSDATVKLDITQTADALAWSDLTVSHTLYWDSPKLILPKVFSTNYRSG